MDIATEILEIQNDVKSSLLNKVDDFFMKRSAGLDLSKCLLSRNNLIAIYILDQLETINCKKTTFTLPSGVNEMDLYTSLQNFREI